PSTTHPFPYTTLFRSEQLGTGHALLMAQPTVDALLPLPQTILVCYGDTPLVSDEMLARVLVEHITQHATITFLTAYTDSPSDFRSEEHTSELQSHFNL